MFYNKIPKTGDPSPEIQNFSKLQISLLCCHYWIIDVWKHTNLSFPYWRLYWNNIPGAKISFKEKEYELTPDKIILIPPFTSFSTFYDPDNVSKTNGDFFIGTPIKNYSRNRIITDKSLKHLFIHFTLGLPYDSIEPQILSLPVSPYIENIITILKNQLHDDISEFNSKLSMLIYSLISSLLWQIPEEKWLTQTSDTRITKILKYIDNNLTGNLSNKKLASKINMSTNSFLRLFTNEAKVSPQQYILKKKIEKACVILHYSKYSIEEIAQKTGFNDRFYFSRVFKKTINISPAAYRKSFKF
jgi:AraC-like DNA-binding protein